MDESGLRLLLLVVGGLALVLLAVHLRLRLALHERVREEVTRWKRLELEDARAELARIARAEAEASLERWRLEVEAGIRQDAVRRSSAVVSGKVGEHLAPWLGSFPYNPKDARFLGAPVDLLVFDGMSEDDLREIVFLEIKTGAGALTSRERRIRDAVLERRVAWREYRLPG